jgi:DNA-binding NarL/FixJ family response regulator
MEHETERGGRTAVLLDPHPLCHVALAGLLARFDAKVVGTATSAACARALLEEHRPDLLVAEIDLPEGRDEGLSLVSLAREQAGLTVVVLSKGDDPDLIDAAFDAGASAFLSKTTDPDEIAAAVGQALASSSYRTNGATATITQFPQARVRPRLTRREVEILKLVAEGRSNREAGQVLWVTDQTVKFHLANIYRKLGVRNRYDAATWARENGLLETSEAPSEVVTLDHDLRTSGTAPGRLTLRRTTTRTLAPMERRFEGTSR